MWQFWFQTDLGFEATVFQLKESRKFAGYSSEKASWFYTFCFKESKDVKYQITTKGKLSISFPLELGVEKRKEFLNRVKPFIIKADGTPAQKFELTQSLRAGKNFDITSYEDLGKSMKIEEASLEEVEECTEAILKALRDGNKNVLSSRVDQIKQLSERKRVANFPQVLQHIEECLESPMLVSNSETFKKLVNTLSNILFFEQYHKPPNMDKIVERIQNKISPKVISLVKENLEFPDFSTVMFLGRCGRKEAVEVIFDKIKSNPSVASKRSDTAHALAELYFEHKRFINQQLDALLKDKDKTLVELAKELRRKIMHQRSIIYG